LQAHHQQRRRQRRRPLLSKKTFAEQVFGLAVSAQFEQGSRARARRGERARSALRGRRGRSVSMGPSSSSALPIWSRQGGQCFATRARLIAEACCVLEGGLWQVVRRSRASCHGQRATEVSHLPHSERMIVLQGAVSVECAAIGFTCVGWLGFGAVGGHCASSMRAVSSASACIILRLRGARGPSAPRPASAAKAAPRMLAAAIEAYVA
jgi:hypothetical protein